MKRLANFNEWRAINEMDANILAYTAAFSILGWKAVKFLLKWLVGPGLGKHTELSKEELLIILDRIMEETAGMEFKEDYSKSDSEIHKEASDQINSGEIKTLGQLQKYFSSIK